MPDNRREGVKPPAEKYDAGQNQYRMASDGSGKLRLKKEFLMHPAENVILHIRQHLTWIEGELDADDLPQAIEYFKQLQPWIYQLKQKLNGE